MKWIILIFTPLIATVVVIIFWPRKGVLGINLKKTFCPACGNPVPRWRKPANERQQLWGGWTCSHCGCEMDKYGKKIES